MNCKYCGETLKPGKYEPWHVFEEREHCYKIRCLARGRVEVLSNLYAKEQNLQVTNLHMGFMVYKVFLYRWGMHPLKAFDTYGQLASDDFWYVKRCVEEGRVAKVLITVAVVDNMGNEMAIEETEEMVLLNEPNTQAKATHIAKYVEGFARHGLGEFQAKSARKDEP